MALGFMMRWSNLGATYAFGVRLSDRNYAVPFETLMASTLALGPRCPGEDEDVV